MSDREPIAIYVGGLSRTRGILELVRAMDEVKTHGARLILAGAFGQSAFEREVKAETGWGSVNFTGWRNRSDIVAHLTQARVGLVTLYPEPNYICAYPNKMFEYMSAALPVIASDFPLWRSIIGRFGCGFVVDPRDFKQIARAIDWMFSHPKEAEEMGKRGQRAVETTYNWANEEKKLIAFYERLLSERRSAAKRTFET
jgi:glycosyltransferase involved in cell wall biosynthesis